MPLDDDPKDLPKAGIKLKQGRTLPKKPDPRAFEQRATDAFRREGDFKQKAYDLGKAFVKLLDDKVLPQNKSPMNKDLEKEALQNLVQLGMDMNDDEAQPMDGMGSIGLITLLMKGMVMQRDRMNELEYKLERSEKKLQEALSRVVANSDTPTKE